MPPFDTYDPTLDVGDAESATVADVPFAAPVTVPFVRDLSRGMSGPDVRAVQRALRHAGVAPDEGFEKPGVYGLRTANSVRRFQRAHRLHEDGVYGKVTHTALKPHFDRWGAELMARAADQHDDDLRKLAVEAAWGAYRIRGEVHYFQERPFEWLRWPRSRIPTRMDCIAEGTLVATARGDVPIEDVVAGDLVATRSGYRMVTRAWLKDVDAPIMAVDLGGGETLRGTADHRVFTTTRGWMSLGSLTEADMLLAWDESSEFASVGTPTSATPITDSPRSAATSSTGRASFIASCGRRLMGRSRKALTCITSTVIRETTTSRISRWWNGRRIVPMPLVAVPLWSTSAPGVAVPSGPRTPGNPMTDDSALRRAARQHTVETVVTRSRRSANGAEARSGRTSTDLTASAPTVARRIIGKPRSDGRAAVYDLTVEGEHEFFAAGVLVHNCSEFVSWCFWVAGADDPNGYSWSGYGYTGTLCLHGKAIPASQAKPGDLAFYGSGAPWGHVAIVVGKGTVLSHGSESGPHYLPIGYRPVGQVRSYLP